jgi:hypothetical protein
MSELKDYKTHPAYGMAHFHRVSGPANDLFGSSIDVDHTIRLTVSQGSVARDLSTNWYSKEGLPIVEVEFSANQFAELLTTMNAGAGVPCTIRYLNGKSVVKPPKGERQDEIKDKFKKEAQKYATRATELAAEARKILAEKNLKAADRNKLTHLLEAIANQMSHNLPFVLDCFNEEMDKTVAEAKAEVDAMFTHKIVELGTEALQQELAEKGLDALKIKDKE